MVDCLKFRQDSHASDYSLLSFLAYFFYFPLYLAGPTLSYNAWRSQVDKPQQTYSSNRLVIYAVRLLLAMVLLELSLHFLCLPALANHPENRKLFASLSAYELAISSYLILKWIWLKFLVIWRFFRMWALCDGIEAPENMGRCMSDNYNFEGFWRMWHRAFNQWLVRYLFIPLGGSRYKVYNIWVVFLFVAVWHDLSLHLLVWGWGMCLFIVPELLAKAFINQERFAAFRQTAAYNWVCAGSASAYIMLMMIANLVGFSFGLEGLATLWRKIVEGEGMFTLVHCWAVITVCTHVVFLWRRVEGKFGYGMKGY